MRRTDRRPAGSWMRAAWLTDEALRITARLHEQITGETHPTLVALDAGREVEARVWELPNQVGDRLRADGVPAHAMVRLTQDDRLETIG
ncbi:hypothetical protein ACPXB3_05810 [Gordonia sp. DT219]|uniref:hypothetical protein n=1 Tax=Gordonia sp. DT219 TaxID=3416658 RepID=UPI003CE76B13